MRTILVDYGGGSPPTFIDRLNHGLVNSNYNLVIVGRGDANRLGLFKEGILYYTFTSHYFQLLTIFVLLFNVRNVRIKLVKWVYFSIVRKDQKLLKKAYRSSVYYSRKIDIIHLHWPNLIEEWSWAFDEGKPVLVSLRGSLVSIKPKIDRDVAKIYHTYFPSVSHFHAVSHSLAEEARLYGAKNIEVIYSGINLKNYPFTPLTNNQTRIRIISIARPHWVKGIPYAIRACRLMADKGIDIEYVIVNSNAEEILSMVSLLELNDIVKFLPKQSHEEVKRLVALSDILLLPSVTEGVANVAIEAMALGTAVISSNTGGMAELIDDGFNGFLFENRNAEKICSAVLRYHILSPEERVVILSNAYSAVANKHSIEDMVNNFKRLFDAFKT